jgi:hypothetical protein
MALAVFMVEEPEDSPVASMDLPGHAGRLALTPARSAALIMEESREASPLAGGRALAEASTEVEVSTGPAAVTGNAVQVMQKQLMIWRKNSCARTI